MSEMEVLHVCLLGNVTQVEPSGKHRNSLSYFSDQDNRISITGLILSHHHHFYIYLFIYLYRFIYICIFFYYIYFLFIYRYIDTVYIDIDTVYIDIYHSVVYSVLCSLIIIITPKNLHFVAGKI